MNKPSDELVIAAMAKFGGAFVKALAEAWKRGDPINRRLIKETWPSYWERYEQMVPMPKFVVGIDWGAGHGPTPDVDPDGPYTGPKKIVVQSGAQSFLVRRVDLGDRYGRDFCLTHPKDEKCHREPMIEFYIQECKFPDYDFVGTREDAIAAGAEPLGYFVSRYYASTLLDRGPTNGLCLHGGSMYDPSVNIEAEALNEALEGLGFPTHILTTK